MSPPNAGNAVAPTAVMAAKRTTRSTNNDAEDATAPASKRHRKNDPAAADEAAEERLDVEAPRKSTSPAADATRPKKFAKTKENIRSMMPLGKGKGRAKAAASSEEQENAAAFTSAQAGNSAIEASKTRGRKPLPTVSSPKGSPTEIKGDVAGDELADVALESVADKNKENLAMRGQGAAGPAGRKNFIDRQADAEKVSQIADSEEENNQELLREAEMKDVADENEISNNDSEIQGESKPEIVSLAGVKRRGKPLTRDVPREEESDDDTSEARELHNAALRREKAAREAEREHELEREEMRRKKLGEPIAEVANMAAPTPAEREETAPSPSFSDMKKVAKEKAALHRQQRGSIKPRKPWTSEEEDTFARLIEVHGCNWAQLERTDEMKAFGGRTQSQLKDKAMNMKALIMKAEAPLPKNFQFISLRATQKEDIRGLGIDPDNYPY